MSNIEDYIGDSKYYSDDNRPKGVALYKQFTYAKNTIQYHIDNYYLTHGRGPWPPRGKGEIRYRDTLTEGYNITPNFFIRSRVTEEDIDFSTPSLKHSFWDKRKNQKNPPTNKHFEDRLFDRDTLILRELVGKTYTLDEGDNHLLVAFERPENSATGKEDKERFLRQRLRNIDTGEEVSYDLSPTSLRELNEQ